VWVVDRSIEKPSLAFIFFVAFLAAALLPPRAPRPDRD
jgi:membrane protein YqaA with SNARE-associated domain